MKISRRARQPGPSRPRTVDEIVGPSRLERMNRLLWAANVALRDQVQLRFVRETVYGTTPTGRVNELRRPSLQILPLNTPEARRLKDAMRGEVLRNTGD